MMTMSQHLYLLAEQAADERENQPAPRSLDDIIRSQAITIRTALFHLDMGEPDKARQALEKV